MSDPKTKRTIIEQQNNGFGPLLKTRGSKAFITSIAMLVFSSVYLFFAHAIDTTIDSRKPHVLLFAATFSFIFLFLGECARRLTLFAEEFCHRDSRYHGDWFKALQSTFTFAYPVRILVALFFSVVIVSNAWYEHSDIIRSNTLWFELFLINIIMMPALSSITGLRAPSKVDQSLMNETDNKNVADGLAWSYYFGYLKLVLPNLKDQINRSSYRDDIQVSKLFILVPRNCYTYGTLSQADSRITVAGSTPELRINRGGIQGRVYKHTVHRIEVVSKLTGDPDVYHCVVEYATPLMSLYDMSQHQEAALSKVERDEQVNIFLSKLTAILENAPPEIRDSYVLIPLSGIDNDIAQKLVDEINKPPSIDIPQ